MGNPAASVLKVHPDLVPSPLSPSESPNHLSSSCSLSPVTCSLVRSTGGETKAELEQPPGSAVGRRARGRAGETAENTSAGKDLRPQGADTPVPRALSPLSVIANLPSTPDARSCHVTRTRSNARPPGGLARCYTGRLLPPTLKGHSRVVLLFGQRRLKWTKP